MKTPKLLFAICLSLLVGLYYGCGHLGSESEASDETATTETVVEETPTEEETAEPAMLNWLMVSHEVSDFDTWKTTFDEHDGTRKEHGLTVKALMQGNDDPNMVCILMWCDNMESAKEFSTSADLKETMEKAGVTGEPMMKWLSASDDIMSSESTNYLVVSHKVTNFDEWKVVFDEHESKRQEFGITALNVFQGPDDPNDVTIMFALDNVEKAKEFGLSEDLKMAMEKAGVAGKPDMWYLTASM